MLFKKSFKVIEIHKEYRVTHYLEGSKKAVNSDIEMFKKNAKNYDVVSKDVMIVWA